MGEGSKAPPAISLRQFELSDVDDMMEWMSDALVSRYTSWDAITTRDEALEHLNTTVFPHPWYSAVCLDGRPVGFISVKPLAGDDRCRALISCSIARKYWGQGITSSAVKMAAAAVFREWPQLERLDALVVVVNRGAQRALEKAGFSREALHRNYPLRKGKVWDQVRASFDRSWAKRCLCEGCLL